MAATISSCANCQTPTETRMLDITHGVCRKCYVDTQIQTSNIPESPVDFLTMFQSQTLDQQRVIIDNASFFTKAYLFGLALDEWKELGTA